MARKTTSRKRASACEKTPTTPNQLRLTALNDQQKAALKTIHENQITLIHGPAGTGKTHLAVGYGIMDFMHGKYESLIFTRPCVEAYGEDLGYLPGDQNQKLAPYMMPIMDILNMFMFPEEVEDAIANKRIRTIPIAFQRGLTFRNAFVVADEFQNTVPKQMRLFLTRIGTGSKVVVTGDLRQSDIQGVNGLEDAIKRLQGVEGIGIVEMTDSCIVRDPIVARIEARYTSNEGNLP